MYMAHIFALPFKDNLLESQIPTWAFILACTSDEHRSSWRSGPNHTPRMGMGPSLQRKGPGRVSLPLQAPSRKPSLLSKLTLAPAIRLYSPTAFFTASISRWRDTNSDVIGERGNPYRKTASKRDTAQGQISPLIPKPTEQRLQSKDIEKRRQGAALPDRTLDRERFPFPCTTAWGLWYIMLIHLLNSGLNLADSDAEIVRSTGAQYVLPALREIYKTLAIQNAINLTIDHHSMDKNCQALGEIYKKYTRTLCYILSCWYLWYEYCGREMRVVAKQRTYRYSQ